MQYCYADTSIIHLPSKVLPYVEQIKYDIQQVIKSLALPHAQPDEVQSQEASHDVYTVCTLSSVCYTVKCSNVLVSTTTWSVNDSS